MGGMGKGGAYAFSRVVVDTQFTKAYVKPRMATGGAIGAEADVARVTKLLITSTAGGLRERSKLVAYSYVGHGPRDPGFSINILNKA